MAPQVFKREEELEAAQKKVSALRPEMNQLAIQATVVAAKVERMISPYIPKESELLEALHNAQSPKNLKDVQFVRA